MFKLLSIFLFCLIGCSVLADTITVNTNTYTSTQISSPTFYGATSPTFTYYGFPTTNYAALNNTNVSSTGISSTNELAKFPPVQVAFTLTGTNFEFEVNSFDYVRNLSSVCYFTIFDGVTTTSYTNVPNTSWLGSPNFIGVTFSSNITHQVILSLKGNFLGINVGAGNTLSTYALPHPNLLIVEGDSYDEGYMPVGTVYGGSKYWFDGYVWQLVNLQTNTLAIPSGIGGTGFIATNSGSDVSYLQRITNDIINVYSAAVASGKYNQIFITAQGSINDTGQNTNTLFINATNIYTILKSNCPLAHLFVLGNWLAAGGRTSPQADDVASDTTFSNVALTVQLPYYSPILANLKNAGNYSIFYPAGSDSIHPSTAGYLIMAQWLNTNVAYTFGQSWTNAQWTNPPVTMTTQAAIHR